jgi:hypothetical protein
MQTTIRVDVTVRDELQAIADAEFDGSPLTRVLAALIKEHRRGKKIQQMREDYARLQARPEEWADYLAELAMWEPVGINDGLEPEDFSWLEDEE